MYPNGFNDRSHTNMDTNRHTETKRGFRITKIVKYGVLRCTHLHYRAMIASGVLAFRWLTGGACP